MKRPEVIYRPHPDATPQTELSALCNAYSYLLETARKKAATRRGAPDDVHSITNPEGVSDVGRRSR